MNNFLCGVSWCLLFISFENWDDVPVKNPTNYGAKIFSKFPLKYIPAIW